MTWIEEIVIKWKPHVGIFTRKDRYKVFKYINRIEYEYTGYSTRIYLYRAGHICYQTISVPGKMVSCNIKC